MHLPRHSQCTIALFLDRKRHRKSDLHSKRNLLKIASHQGRRQDVAAPKTYNFLKTEHTTHRAYAADVRTRAVKILHTRAKPVKYNIRNQWRTQKIFRGFSRSGIWFSFVFGVRCFWRHYLASYSCFQTNILAKSVDIIMHIFLHPLPLFYVSLHWI